ncbi:beta-glucosidase 38-like isoform X2 [Phragmites australis]|uniref:beta-glucosidase 38-like isoform X2 n=1 Tax=Phragmites australis TaxID=29695 RepID=UPI002D770604|nr:beta-glucosidase 38-like isoform X2 [Phragmites australis]
METFLLLHGLLVLSLALGAHGKAGENTNLTRESFPPGFVFGTASSAYQVEGNALKYGRGPCIWDTFLKYPGATPDNATANVTVDEYHRYMVYFCFKTYGDRVKNWFTINEPRMMAVHGYGDGFFAPGRCTGCRFGGNSATEPYIAGHHLLLSHAAAVKIYREKYQVKQKGKIGILLDFVWYESLTKSIEDEFAAHRARMFTLGWFLHPITYGHYPETMEKIVMGRLPNFTYEQATMVKGSADYIGINHYTTYYASNYINETQKSYRNDWNVKLSYERDGVPIGKKAYSDWLYVVPWGIYKAVMWTKEKFNNPVIIIGENGIDQPGDETLPGALYDTFRIDYFEKYLHELKCAVNDGANVTGYFAWSLLDNFEWRLGFTSKFGIVYVDRQTFNRYPKDSTRWFRKVIKNEH